MPDTFSSGAFYLEFDRAPGQVTALECAFVLRDQGKFSRLSQTEFASHLTTVRFAYDTNTCSGFPEISVTPPGTAPRHRKAPENGWVFGAKFRCCVVEALQGVAPGDLTKLAQRHMKLMKANLPMAAFEAEFCSATRDLCDFLRLTHERPAQADNASLDRNVSCRTVRRRFQALTGIAPKRHHILSRFHSTLPALARNDQSLSDIAYACDYSDQSHLSRDFRRITGHTPQQLSKLWQAHSVRFVQDRAPASTLRLAISFD